MAVCFRVACPGLAGWSPLRTSANRLDVLYFGPVSRLRVWGYSDAVRCPRLGARMAGLLEAPVMLAVTIAAARWLVIHLAVPFELSARIGMGCVALGLLLIAEFALVNWL